MLSNFFFEPLGTNFSGILIKIQKRLIHANASEISSAKGGHFVREILIKLSSKMGYLVNENQPSNQFIVKESRHLVSQCHWPPHGVSIYVKNLMQTLLDSRWSGIKNVQLKTIDCPSDRPCFLDIWQSVLRLDLNLSYPLKGLIALITHKSVRSIFNYLKPTFITYLIWHKEKTDLDSWLFMDLTMQSNGANFETQ